MSTEEKPFFSHEEHALIRKAHPDLTDDEFATAILVATKRRLMPPPLSNQIFFMKRKTRELVNEQWCDVWKLSIQTGIDGYRLIAERTGKYLGSSIPQHEHNKDGLVMRTTMEIYKVGPGGQRVVVGAEAWFDEYAQWTGRGENRKLNLMWETKGHMMLSKCCESIGLRKAFPEDLSGIYTQEEMGQAENEQEQATAWEAAPKRTQATPEQKAEASERRAVEERREAKSDQRARAKEEILERIGILAAEIMKTYGVGKAEMVE